MVAHREGINPNYAQGHAHRENVLPPARGCDPMRPLRPPTNIRRLGLGSLGGTFRAKCDDQRNRQRTVTNPMIAPSPRGREWPRPWRAGPLSRSVVLPVALVVVAGPVVVGLVPAAPGRPLEGDLAECAHLRVSFNFRSNAVWRSNSRTHLESGPNSSHQHYPNGVVILRAFGVHMLRQTSPP